jgi:hypothetical protein
VSDLIYEILRFAQNYTYLEGLWRGAIIVIAETGPEIKAFENSGKIARWTGLRPKSD